uniref:27 kDa salivary protein n=1 Tax=Phlebotomus ariasi TaxID=59272 RepID=Q2TJC8_9DIPT|nr:27 kDa salivary protein [Phlebotomus ariasi]
MNILLKVAILVSLCEIGYSWKYPRNADQTLWAWRSCQKGNYDPELVKKWMAFEIPDDEVTHCYIKCVWTHLGMYDETSQTIRADRVKQQFKARGLSVPAEISHLEGSTGGSCVTIYKKTRAFLETQMPNYRIAFYGTVEESDKWFANNPETKPKRIKISDFCKGREAGTEGTCKHACSMYYYRLVDEDNLVIPFRKLPGILDSQLEQCRDQASSETGCKVGDTIYNCLNRINPEGLKKALNTLDEQSLTLY